MRGRAGFPALALVLAAGCGVLPEPTPELPPPTRASRPVPPVPTGPEADRNLVERAPEDAFLYAALLPEEAFEVLDSLLPPVETGLAPPTDQAPGAARPGLGAWLARLHRAAGTRRLFQGPVALALGARERPEQGLDFWLATEGPGALSEVLAEQGLGPAGGTLEAPEGTLHARRDGAILVLSSRPQWLGAPTGDTSWQSLRRRVAKAAPAFVLISLDRYLDGPLGALMAERSPRELALTRVLRTAAPEWIAEAFPRDRSLRVELSTRPTPGDLADLLRKSLEGGSALSSPAETPGIAGMWLGASLDWEAAGRLRDRIQGVAPAGLPGATRPASAFTSPATPGAEDPTALAAGFASWLRGLVGEALLDWAGPEVAAMVTWDVREPRVGLLLGHRSAKKAAGAVERFHQSEAGRRLAFVDGTVHGLRYRYTRLDGVDPRWLEPAYGFHRGYLVLASARSLLFALSDPGSPRLEEHPALSGLVARLGEGMRMATLVDPTLLVRAMDLAIDAGGPSPAKAEARARFADLSTRCRGIAMGLGADREGTLRLVLSTELRGDPAAEAGVPAEAATTSPAPSLRPGPGGGP